MKKWDQERWGLCEGQGLIGMLGARERRRGSVGRGCELNGGRGAC